MKTKIRAIIATLTLMSLLIPLRTAYANHGSDHRSHKYYRHHRYYPKNYFLYRRIYHYPKKRYYYYYDLYPRKQYYYDCEKDIYPVNPNYISILTIANMASQGVPETVIISEIKRTRSVYKLTSEVIAYLKQNNVSDYVIDYMLETGKGRY